VGVVPDSPFAAVQSPPPSSKNFSNGGAALKPSHPASPATPQKKIAFTASSQEPSTDCVSSAISGGLEAAAKAAMDGKPSIALGGLVGVGREVIVLVHHSSGAGPVGSPATGRRTKKPVEKSKSPPENAKERFLIKLYQFPKHKGNK
jgi:hypothetical protein